MLQLLIIIGYIALSLLAISLLLYRIKKKTFASYLTEEIGILFFVIVTTSIVDVAIEIKVVIFALTLITFCYGSYKK